MDMTELAPIFEQAKAEANKVQKPQKINEEENDEEEEENDEEE